MNVLILDRFNADALRQLSQNSSLNISHEPNEPVKVESLAKTEILIIRSKTKVDEPFLQKTPRLKYLITTTSGYDHIDLKLCHEKNISVEFTPDANADAAAELTWAHLLNLQRHLLQAHISVVKDRWRTDLPIGSELSGKKIFIIGLGRIGTRVARYAKAFQMEVAAHDPFILPHKFQQESVASLDFEMGLKWADIVTFHVPKTEKTHYMLNSKNISCLTKNTLLLNLSRGDVIEEKALLAQLKKGELRGAGLDVFAKEPLDINHELLSLPNVLLSPHIGAYTEEALKKGSLAAVHKVFAYLKQEKPQNPL